MPPSKNKKKSNEAKTKKNDPKPSSKNVQGANANENHTKKIKPPSDRKISESRDPNEENKNKMTDAATKPLVKSNVNEDKKGKRKTLQPRSPKRDCMMQRENEKRRESNISKSQHPDILEQFRRFSINNTRDPLMMVNKRQSNIEKRESNAAKTSLALEKRGSSLVKRGSSLARASGAYQRLKTPKGGLKSTTTYTAATAASCLAMEVIGPFVEKNNLNRITNSGKTIELFHMKSDDVSSFAKFDIDEAPILMGLIKNDQSKDLIFLLSNKHNISLWAYDDQKYNKCYDQPITGNLGDPLNRIVSSFDTFSKSFAFAFEKNNMTVLYWRGGKPFHETIPVEPKHVLNLLLVYEKNDHIEIITQSRGKKDGNICMDKHLRTFNLDTLKLSEYKEKPEKQCYNPGHLIGLPPPLSGHVELASNVIRFQQGHDHALKIKIDSYKHMEFSSFGVLSTNKVIALTKKNELLLIDLETSKKETSKKVIDIHVHLIQHSFNLIDIIPCDEYMMCLRMANGSLTYQSLDRLGNTSEKDEKIRSPPQEVHRRECPENSDSVKLEDQKQNQQFPLIDWKEGTIIMNRYILKKLIGSGAFGKVYKVDDTQEKEKSKVLKVVGPAHNQSFSKEVAALDMCKSLSGVVELLDSFEYCNNYFLVLPDCGEPIVNPLKRNNPRCFSLDNVVSIGYFLVNTMVHIHDIGLLHRDMHICNLLVKCHKDKKAVLKIIDFGLAECITDQASEEIVEKRKKEDLKECAKIIVEMSNQSHTFTYFKQENTYFTKIDESNRWINHLCQTIDRDGGSTKQILECFSKEHTTIERRLEIDYKIVESDGKDVVFIM